MIYCFLCVCVYIYNFVKVLHYSEILTISVVCLGKLNEALPLKKQKKKQNKEHKHGQYQYLV